MPKALLVAGGLSTNGAATQFVPFAQSSCNANSIVEAEAQVNYRTSGVTSGLFINFVTNGHTLTQTARLRINGSNGSSSIAVSSGATGLFEDTTGSDIIAPGDLVCIQVEKPGTGNSQFSGVGAIYTTSSNRIYTSNFGANARVASATDIFGITGQATASNNNQRPLQDISGVARFLSVYVSANTRTSNTTYRIVKNGSNGSMLVTVGASATGFFEDSSNSDTLAVGDQYLYQRITTAGSGSITNTNIYMEIDFDNSRRVQYNCQTTFASPSTNNSRANIFGYNSSYSTTNETRYATNCPDNITMRDFRISVNANSRTGASVFTIRKNSVDTALSISVPTTTTGRFSDTSNTVDFVTGDDITVGFTFSAGAGSIQPRDYQFTMIYPVSVSFVPKVIFM